MSNFVNSLLDTVSQARGRKVTKSLILSCIFSAAVLMTVFKDENSFLDEPSIRRETSNVVEKNIRPIMHTFYHSDAAGEDALLEVWKMEWQSAGFDTKVLDLKDSKKHPYFHEMENKMKGKVRDKYNMLCFYRWLAMGASGGGWMSDYDTFPTNFPLEEGRDLPNDGKFTSYGGHVPALMSGSEEEWTRVAKLVLDAIPRIPGKMNTDMYAFEQLHVEESKEGKDYGILFLRPWYHLKANFNYLSPRKVDCEAMKVGRAVHLSHAASDAAVKNNIFPVTFEGRVGHHRSEAARIFLEDWREQCLVSKTERKST